MLSSKIVTQMNGADTDCLILPLPLDNGNVKFETTTKLKAGLDAASISRKKHLVACLPKYRSFAWEKVLGDFAVFVAKDELAETV